MIKDYYAILGIDKDSTKDEIKKAYRKLARRFHPDINPQEPSSGEKFVEINKAYIILSDVKRREMYDTIWDVEINPQAYQDVKGVPISKRTWVFRTPEIKVEPSNYIKLNRTSRETRAIKKTDVFKDLPTVFDVSKINKNIRESSAPRDGDDLRYDLEISFMESFNGGQKQFRFMDPSSDTKKSLIISYSKGVRDGNILRLEGKGMPGVAGGSNGDLYVVIRVKSHQTLKRKGDDVIVVQEIHYTTAILGGEISVSGIVENFKIIVPPKTKDSTLLRVLERGFFNDSNQKRGDFLVKVKIKVPDRINAFQKKKLDELRNLGL